MASADWPMMSRVKSIIRDFIPPILERAIRSYDMPHIYRGDFPCWGDAASVATGYDSERILARVRSAALSVKSGEAVFERDSVLFDRIEIRWPVLTGLMLAAGRDGSRLGVLDFGGSLGSCYSQNRNFTSLLEDVAWGVVEQPQFVACGRAEFEDSILRFYTSVAECNEAVRPNVALFGSVLQYLDNPLTVLNDVSHTDASILIIDRTPFSELAEDRVCVQHVPPTIYDASYPMRIFSRSVFEKRLPGGWELLEEFESPEGVAETDAGVRLRFGGMIYTR